MYNFDGFLEDYTYLAENKEKRLQIKLNNMDNIVSSKRPSTKSITGAYKKTEKYHFIKPMMSRHKELIVSVARLLPWSKEKDSGLYSAIQTIAGCINRSGKTYNSGNDLADLAWALKDMYNAKTSWEKFTVKQAWQRSYTDKELSYTERRRQYNSIPQAIRTMTAWRNSSASSLFNEDFIQSYKYRTLNNGRLTWFHSGLASRYARYCTTLDNDLTILYNKMSKVNDINTVKAWVKAMAEFHPANISSDLSYDIETFIADGARMYRRIVLHGAERQYILVDYKNMSVLEMINASVFNHRIEAEHNRQRIAGIYGDVQDNDMPSVDLPRCLEDLRIKTSNEMRKTGSECGHCIGSYDCDTSHMFFRKGNVCAMVNMTTGNIIQCFDRKNKRTPASRSFENYLKKELKNKDIVWRAEPPKPQKRAYIAPF